jgi:hypothetical protein
MKIQATEAYTDWLSSAPWNLFVTITSARNATPETMLKETRWFMNKTNKHLYGKNWFKRTQGIEHVIGLERQKRGAMHSHSLVRFPDHDMTPDLLRWLRHTALGKKIQNPSAHQQAFPYHGGLSGWSKIEIPRDQADITGYVCKYVTKEGDIYISASFDPSAPRTYSQTLMGQKHV